MRRKSPEQFVLMLLPLLDYVTRLACSTGKTRRMPTQQPGSSSFADELLGAPGQGLQIALELMEHLLFSQVLHGVLARGPAEAQTKRLIFDQE